MNFESARFNMVEQQVRPWDVLDQTILDLMGELPREDFVPSQYRKLAYADTAIPLNEKAQMLPPREVGRILQAVKPSKNDFILEVGSGSGYLTALLAQLARTVVSVDCDASLLEIAKKNVEHAKLNNVVFQQGDASQGWEQEAPYDVICVTGAVSEKPQAFMKHLQTGGRLFAFVGEAPLMKAMLYTRLSETQWQEVCLYETVVPMLQNAEKKQSFTFE